MSKIKLVGKKIVSVTKMSQDELEMIGLDSDIVSLKINLDDGSFITALCDEEGNGPGILVMGDDKNNSWDVAPEK